MPHWNNVTRNANTHAYTTYKRMMFLCTHAWVCMQQTWVLVALDRLHSEYNIVQGLHIIFTWDIVKNIAKSGIWYCRRDSSEGRLPMYWSLDKGYLVYLFSVAYLKHWNWPFVFSTAKRFWLHTAQQKCWFGIKEVTRTKFDYFPDSSSLGTIHFWVHSPVHGPVQCPESRFCSVPYQATYLLPPLDTSCHSGPYTILSWSENLWPEYLLVLRKYFTVLNFAYA